MSSHRRHVQARDDIEPTLVHPDIDGLRSKGTFSSPGRLAPMRRSLGPPLSSHNDQHDYQSDEYDETDSSLSYTDSESSLEEEEELLEDEKPSKQRGAIGSPTLGRKSTHTDRRRHKEERQDQRPPREDPRRQPNGQRVVQKSSPSSEARLISNCAYVAMIALLLGGFFYFKPIGGADRCGSGLQRPTEDIRHDLATIADFGPLFDSHSFIAHFRHRIIGRPTVVHIVSKDELLLSRTSAWLRQNYVCAGFFSIQANLGNFIETVSSLAYKYDGTSTNDPESCRMILVIHIKDSQFDKTNRDWLESIVDDTKPIAFTRHGQFNTENWCVLLMDHWTEEFSMRTGTWSGFTAEQVSADIRDSTAPLWTGRFYQRVQATFFAGKPADSPQQQPNPEMMAE